MTSLDQTFHICEVEAMAVVVGPSVCINLRDGEWPVRRLVDSSHVENGNNRIVTVIEGCRGGSVPFRLENPRTGSCRGKRSSHSQNSGRGGQCRPNQERDGQRPRKNETEP